MIAKLSGMADNLPIDHDPEQDHDQVPADLQHWDSMSFHLDNFRKERFLSMALGSAPERRQGQIRDYLGQRIRL